MCDFGESSTPPQFADLYVSGANMEGKEVRFGESIEYRMTRPLGRDAGIDRLLAHQVLQIRVVLLTDVFERFHAGIKANIPAHSPGFRVGAGVFDGGLVMQDQFIDACETLGDVELFGVRMAGGVQPRPVVESCYIHHQRIAVPVADALA